MDEVSIVGGGIAGLMIALCFEKLGIDYKLYERAETLKEIGAGIWMSPNALQVIEWISPQLLAEIRDTGNSFDRILLADHQLSPISDSNQQFVKEKYGYSTLAIHRGKLQKILYSYLSGDNVILGKPFLSYSINADNTYQIKFQDGASVATKAIIGADGIKSAVRMQLFPMSSLRYAGQTCWRGVAAYELDENLASTGFTLWGKKLQFGVSKIGYGKTYWFAVQRSEPNGVDITDTLKADLSNMFEAFHPVVQQLIENTASDRIIRGDLSDLELLDMWSVDKICLIGDAAHAMTPDLGQGGAQAIEDAFYLSNCMNNSDDVSLAFEEFYNYRKAKVQKLVRQSRATSKIAITNRLFELIRNLVLRYTPNRFMEKQMIDLYSIDRTVVGS